MNLVGTIKKRQDQLIALTVDMMIVALAILLIDESRNETLQENTSFLASPMLAALLLIVSAMLYWLLGLHRQIWIYLSLDDLLLLTLWTGLTAVFLTSFQYVMLTEQSALDCLLFFSICLSLSWLARCCFRAVQKTDKEDNAHQIPDYCLLMGMNQHAGFLIDAQKKGILKRPVIAGILDRHQQTGRTFHGIPVLGGPGNLSNVIANLNAQAIEISCLVQMDERPYGSEPGSGQIIYDTERLGLRLIDARDLLSEINFSFEKNPSSSTYYFILVKDTFIRLVQKVLFLNVFFFLFPLICVCSICVRIFINRSVFFKQLRVGYQNKPFLLIKFTSMHDRDSKTGIRQKIPATGNFLRKTRMDELPQLMNVLNGEMSWVGPRPLIYSELAGLPEALLKVRASVRPGLTGWAQVNGGKLLAMEDKLILDLWYIQNKSLALNIVILLKTFVVAFTGDQINYRALKVAKRSISSISISHSDATAPTQRVAA